MKEFFIGLLVLLLMALLSVVGILLLPFVFVLGFFLKWLILLVLMMFSIWLIGKFTLFIIEALRKKGN